MKQHLRRNSRNAIEAVTEILGDDLGTTVSKIDETARAAG